MSWLRLDGMIAGDPRLIRDEHGRLVEVQVDCVPTTLDVEICCLARKLVKNGSKTVHYRDVKIEPEAPTWLHIRRQRFKCASCGRTLYQAVPHVDERHMVTTRLKDAVASPCSTDRIGCRRCPPPPAPWGREHGSTAAPAPEYHSQEAMEYERPS